MPMLEKVLDLYHPTGKVFYDIVIPTIVILIGCGMLAVFGVLSENAMLWCFGVSAAIHVFLSWLAGLNAATRKKNETHQRKSG
jgi:hypothetical protein